MSKKLSATLVGTLVSLIGVVLWVLLDVFVGIISGWLAILMVLAFGLIYNKMNPEDKSKYPVVYAALMFVVELLLALGFTILFVSMQANAEYGLTLADLFASSEFIGAIVGVVLWGVLFGTIGVVVYAVMRKRANNPAPAGIIGTTTSAESAASDKTEQIKKLGELKDKGAITEEEFETQKKKIIES